MMPFEGGISSTANGTLLLAVAAALIHVMGGGHASPLRRTAAAAAPAGLMAILSLIVGGPILLALSLAAAAAGEALLAQDRPKMRATARAAFGFSAVFAAVLVGQAAAGGFVPAMRLTLAAGAWLLMLAGMLPAFFETLRLLHGGPSGQAAVALRHAGAIALGLAVLS